jgi:hypothetical protein
VQQATEIALVCFVPDQGGASAASLQKKDDSDRAGFGGAANAAAVAGVANGRLGRRFGVQDDGLD